MLTWKKVRTNFKSCYRIAGEYKNRYAEASRNNMASMDSLILDCTLLFQSCERLFLPYYPYCPYIHKNKEILRKNSLRSLERSD